MTIWGNSANGVINAQISGYGFALFELRISGFTDEYKNLKLAMGAYVIATDDETTEYSYMQATDPDQGEKYSFISYNDVAGNASTEE